MNDKTYIEKLKTFWRDEIIASEVYQALANKAKEGQRELFIRLAKMEQGHAELWQRIAEDHFGATFERSLGRRVKIFFIKIFFL